MPDNSPLLRELAAAQRDVREWQTALEDLRRMGVQAERGLVAAKAKLEDVQNRLAEAVGKEKAP